MANIVHVEDLIDIDAITQRLIDLIKKREFGKADSKYNQLEGALRIRGYSGKDIRHVEHELRELMHGEGGEVNRIALAYIARLPNPVERRATVRDKYDTRNERLVYMLR